MLPFTVFIQVYVKRGQKGSMLLEVIVLQQSPWPVRMGPGFNPWYQKGNKERSRQTNKMCSFVRKSVDEFNLTDRAGLEAAVILREVSTYKGKPGTLH